MTTDRELLELAALAAGVEIIGNIEKNRWNPLTDDGDALRLAVKLGLCIDINPCFEILVSYESEFDQISEPAKDDPCAATRRAILRAAAGIGRNMK